MVYGASQADGGILSYAVDDIRLNIFLRLKTDIGQAGNNGCQGTFALLIAQ